MGVVATILGNGSPGYTGDGGPATAATCSWPNGVAVGPDGDIFVAEWGSGIIRRIDVATGVVSTFAGPGVYGVPGDGGPASGAYFDGILGLAFDSTGRLYACENNTGTIRRILTNGTIETIAGPGTGPLGDGGPAIDATIFSPIALAFDSVGNLYVTCGDARIRKINLTTGIITTVAGTGNWGYSGDGGLATLAEIEYPAAIAFDSQDNLYYCEEDRAVVRRIDAVTGIITTIFGDGDNLEYTGDDGLASAAQGFAAIGIAIDTDGNIFFSDKFAIRRIDAQTGVVTRFIGQGDSDPFSGGYGDDGLDRLAVGLYEATAITISGNDLIYTQRQAHIVRRTALSDITCCNGTAGDLIEVIRPMINDYVTPFRHSDLSMLQWLSDGQRIIAQLVPEALPRTVLFSPALNTVRQRLDMDDAHALIRVEQNHATPPALDPVDGSAIPAVDRDVYDTFDPDWMSRNPDPAPEPGYYFDGFCFDPNDSLGFFLHPLPTSSRDQVYVTYAAVPTELTELTDCVELPSNYHGALINYVIYRAASSQTYGSAPAAAARAIERFGQQLNLPRDTILKLIGAPHRQMEQQQ